MIKSVEITGESMSLSNSEKNENIRPSFLKRVLGTLRRVFYVQMRLNRAQVVHIMFNDKFNKPFVDFLNRNFDPKKHLILCKRVADSVANPFPAGKNVVEIGSVKNLDFSSKKIKKIICHSLFMEDLVEKLYAEPQLLEKAFWDMWGGDLYEAVRDEKNDFVRTNFKGYIGENDRDYAISKYGMTGDFYDASYNFPLSKALLDRMPAKKGDCLKIQINNSCDESTLEILNALSKFKDENIRITTVLSYGGTPALAGEIVKKGKALYGEKFEYVGEMMPPDDYAKFLAGNDILILNQKRQQGFGNVIASLYLGKKVFIKKSVSVNRYLNKQGIKIFDTEDLVELDFEALKKYEERQKTVKNVSRYLDETYLAECWGKVFSA